MTPSSAHPLRESAPELTPLERVILQEDFLFAELDALYERIRAVQAERKRLELVERLERARELRQAKRYLGENVREVA